MPPHVRMGAVTRRAIAAEQVTNAFFNTTPTCSGVTFNQLPNPCPDCESKAKAAESLQGNSGDENTITTGAAGVGPVPEDAEQKIEESIQDDGSCHYNNCSYCSIQDLKDGTVRLGDFMEMQIFTQWMGLYKDMTPTDFAKNQETCIPQRHGHMVLGDALAMKSTLSQARVDKLRVLAAAAESYVRNTIKTPLFAGWLAETTKTTQEIAAGMVELSKKMSAAKGERDPLMEYRAARRELGRMAHYTDNTKAWKGSEPGWVLCRRLLKKARGE